MDEAQGANAGFQDVRIEDSSAKAVNFTGVRLKGARLTETSFERAVLREALLDNAEGDGIDFRGANFNGASLLRARFYEADFRGADLRNADLSRGCFHYADFRGALLDGTLFDGADCRGAVFDAGKGPHADTAKSDKAPDMAFNETVAAVFDGGLSRVFTAHDGFVEQVSDRLQSALEAFRTTSKPSPDELRNWAELLMTLTKGEHPVDLEALIEAVYEGPIELRKVLVPDEAPKAEVLSRVRSLVESLNSAADQPPAEVKAMILRLRDELELDETVSVEDVLSQLLKRKGR